MPKLTLIIPCYNEAKRLDTQAFLGALKDWPGLSLLFVNDASTDDTPLLLEQMHQQQPGDIRILHHDLNLGKAVAVRTGLLEAIHQAEIEYVGYLDADLSTSLDEFFRITALGIQENADFLFGSRIKMLNHQIERNFFRHVAGRVIASITDSFCRLRIYDTQCGAKLYRVPIIKTVISTPFYTRWLFDIEIFMRIRKQFPMAKGMEIPLLTWKEYGKSKITFRVIPQVCMDLLHLYGKYK